MRVRFYQFLSIDFSRRIPQINQIANIWNVSVAPISSAAAKLISKPISPARLSRSLRELSQNVADDLDAAWSLELPEGLKLLYQQRKCILVVSCISSIWASPHTWRPRSRRDRPSSRSHVTARFAAQQFRRSRRDGKGYRRSGPGDRGLAGVARVSPSQS
jgi:hypothetical protein